MKKIILSSLLFVISLFSHAKPFEAMGTGASIDEARRNAVANAIKFSVGEYVTSNETLNNDEFEQRINVYSNAYIKRSTIKSQEQQNGEYKVIVSVELEQQEIVGVIRTIQPNRNNEINKNLIKEIDSKLDAHKYNETMATVFGQLVDELLVNPILENKEVIIVEHSSKDLKFVKIDDETNRLIFEYPVKFSINREYVKSIHAILKELKDIDEQKYKIDVYQYRLSRLDKANKLETFSVNKKRLDALQKSLDNITDFNKTISLSVLDSKNQAIANFSFSDRINSLDSDHFTSDAKNLYYLFRDNLFPQIRNEKFIFYAGSTSPTLIFSLSEQEYEKFKDGGKVSFEFKFNR